MRYVAPFAIIVNFPVNVAEEVTNTFFRQTLLVGFVMLAIRHKNVKRCKLLTDPFNYLFIIFHITLNCFYLVLREW